MVPPFQMGSLCSRTRVDRSACKMRCANAEHAESSLKMSPPARATRLEACLRETSPPQSGIMGKIVRRVFALNGSSRAQRARSIFSRYVILGAGRASKNFRHPTAVTSGCNSDLITPSACCSLVEPHQGEFTDLYQKLNSQIFQYCPPNNDAVSAFRRNTYVNTCYETPARKVLMC